MAATSYSKADAKKVHEAQLGAARHHANRGYKSLESFRNAQSPKVRARKLVAAWDAFAAAMERHGAADAIENAFEVSKEESAEALSDLVNLERDLREATEELAQS